ncbi:MAG: HlyD family efflux transporter periplasmic adaptor subunit [Pseudomonadota bacterium]
MVEQVPVVAAEAASQTDDARVDWESLRSHNPADFAKSFLSLVTAQIPRTRAAILELHRPGVGLEVVAQSPMGRDIPKADKEMLSQASIVAQDRKAAVGRLAGNTAFAAHPVLYEDRVQAVLSLSADMPDPAGDVETVLDEMRAASGWLRAWIAESARREAAPSLARAREALNLVARILEEEGFRAASLRAVTELASLGACDRASFGAKRPWGVKVEAISNAAQFGGRLAIVKRVAEAMNEAIDQRSAILIPTPEGTPPVVDRAHRTLIQSADGAHVLTLPVFRDGKVVGAFTFERMAGAPFDQESIDLLDAASHLTGSLLVERRLATRGPLSVTWDTLRSGVLQIFGARHLALKLILIALVIATIVFSQLKAPYRVTADAVLEGELQRTLAAPFGGFIADARRQAGDAVAAGDVLALLDDRDLRLEALQLRSELRGSEIVYEQALGAGDRAQLNIASAQMDLNRARLDLVESRIARASITAPFDGILVSGDLSQEIGTAVERGEPLFQIAPLDAYRVVLWTDQRQIDDVIGGAEGELVLQALPDEAFGLEVSRLTPIAEVFEGRLAFRVDARLLDNAPDIRPGMQGIGKIDAGERLLIWIWTRGLIDWTRLQAWRVFG